MKINCIAKSILPPGQTIVFGRDMNESCGKCTPCREGTFWLAQIYERLENGEGTAADIDKLLDISDTVNGKSFCALGDGAASPIISSIQHFRDEYVAHVTQQGCPFDPRDSMLVAPEGATV